MNTLSHRNKKVPDMETNEAFSAREKNPADLSKLEEYNPKMVETSCVKVAGPDRRAGKANEA